MSVPEKLDTYLLGKMQKATDFIYDTFGITKFRIEKWAIILSGLSYAMFAVMAQILILVGIAALLNIFSILNVYLCEKEERSFFADGKISLPRTDASFRMLFLLLWIVMTPLLLIDFVGLMLFVYAVASLTRYYANACIPRPPRKSKIRQLLEKAREYFREVAMPAPVFAPIRK